MPLYRVTGHNVYHAGKHHRPGTELDLTEAEAASVIASLRPVDVPVSAAPAPEVQPQAKPKAAPAAPVVIAPRPRSRRSRAKS